MAHSRLEKIGTIFSRVSGLLRSGAMKPDDKPLWYDVYAAFPPKIEPRFDRPAPNMKIKPIFYKEDVVRAKYHKSLKFQDSVNLSETANSTKCQEFISIYNNLSKQGPLDDEKIFETAQDLFNEKNNKIHFKQDKKEQGDSTVFVSDTKKNEAETISVKDLFKD